MPLLQWKPSYSLGVASVDLEHREMIRMINEIYEQLQEKTDDAAVASALGNIHAGIAAHFALEERLMRESGYGEYQGHKEDHEDLLDQIRDLMDTFADDPVAGQARLQSGLSSWFVQHFATFDARLHRHFPG